MRKRDKRRWVIQRHHLEYQPGLKFEDKIGEVVLIYQAEHWVITQLQRRSTISKGLLRALEYWIEQVKHKAIALQPIAPNQ